MIRAATAFRVGSIRISVESLLLIAQTAPSPAVRAPPPKSTGVRVSAIRAMTFAPRGSAPALLRAVWELVAVIARGCAAVEVALIRASVLEAKLLTQTEFPAGATAKAGAGFAGGATRIGGPAGFPERRSIRVAVPWTASPTNR